MAPAPARPPARAGSGGKPTQAARPAARPTPHTAGPKTSTNNARGVMSLAPSTFTQGGFVDDVDATITQMAFCPWDYNGQRAESVLALMVEYDLGEGGEPWLQYYSLGAKASSYAQPSEDGRRLEQIADKNALNAKSNAGQFLASLVAAGFPEDRLADGDVGVVEGTNVHLRQFAQANKMEGNEDKTILLIEKVNSLPEDTVQPATSAPARAAAPARAGTGQKPAPAPARGKTAPTQAAAGNEELEAEAQGFVFELVTQEGQVAKRELAQKLFKVIPQANGNKSKIIQLAYTDTFLKSGPWNYADGIVTLAE